CDLGFRAQLAHRAILAVHLNQPRLGVNDPHERHTGLEIVFHVLRDFVSGVVRGDHFYCQIGGNGQIAILKVPGRKPLEAHKGDIRSSNFRWSIWETLITECAWPDVAGLMCLTITPQDSEDQSFDKA